MLGRGWGSQTTENEVAQIARFLPNVRLAVDGGAHSGRWTAALLAKYPQAFVHMIEPASIAQAALRRRFSGCKRVEIHKWAASDCEGSSKLHSDRAGSSLASLIRRDGEALGFSFDHRETVPTRKLDSCLGWLEGFSELDVLKLDVEGFELRVLQGAERLLERTRLVQFEFGGCHLDARTAFRDFWNFFIRRDFNLFRCSPLGPLPVRDYTEAEEFYAPTNFFAMRREDLVAPKPRETFRK